jgi:carbon storage regulator
MLVLTRKLDERIKIGNNIYVTVVRCGNDKVRIGIDAPDNVPILRAELLEKDGYLPLYPKVHDNGDEPLH